MPIPQDYDRHIPPLSGEEFTPEEATDSVFDIPDEEEPEVEELEDGSAIVRMPTK